MMAVYSTSAPNSISIEVASDVRIGSSSVAPPVSKSLCCHMAWEFMRLPASTSLPQWLRTVPNHQPLKFQKQERCGEKTSQNSPMLKKLHNFGNEVPKFPVPNFCPRILFPHVLFAVCVFLHHLRPWQDQWRTHSEMVSSWLTILQSWP